jgi:hypothetical protein
MNDQTVTYVAYGLALLVGAICFLLVKHTADEFDRWYEQPRFRRIHFPAVLISVALIFVLLLAAR